MNLPSDASQDQSGCPNDYYRRVNGMLHQIPAISNTEAQESVDLTRLDEMSREELVALVKTICGARWGEVAGMTEDEIADSMKLKLAHGGLTQTDIWKALPAMKEWFDRAKGKAPQSIAMKIEDNTLTKVATERLLRLASMLDDPIVIAPMPQKNEN